VESKTPALELHRLPASLTLQATAKHPLLIGGDTGGATLDAVFEGGGEKWRVRFDGVNALAESILAQ
jgi:general secretion pathway protein H